jgi:germination protein M
LIKMAAKKGKAQKGRKGKAKKKSGLPFSFFLIGAVIILIAGAYLLLKYGKAFLPSPIPEEKITKLRPPEEESKLIALYFSGEENDTLVSEKRTIKKGSITEEAKLIINGLVQGPQKGNSPTIPSGTVLLEVTIRDRIATVNFSKELSLNHPGGSAAELSTVYSIVNSLTFNLPEIEKVQILINGEKTKTLKGHIDIFTPLKGEKEFVKG